MTRDDIIRIADECGALLLEGWDVDMLARFAKRIAAAEREHCAKLVEPTDEHRRDASWGYLGGEEGVELLDAIAAAIRSRSQA